MKIASRNVNGIRAVTGKGFYDWVKKEDPDIICLQEVKSFEAQIPPEFRFHLKDYERIRHAGQRPGYAGVATIYKKKLKLISGISKFDSIEHFHEDGRVIETKFQEFTLLNLYFPNGGERADGTEMLSYKLEFYKHFIHYINKLRDKKEKIITCGDFNICHREIDIARPKENEKNIGFLPIERAELDTLEGEGYVDVFRHFYPDKADSYTRRSHWAGSRARNVGRRLDYFRVSKDVVPHIEKITHETAVEGSDHCPIVIELDF